MSGPMPACLTRVLLVSRLHQRGGLDHRIQVRSRVPSEESIPVEEYQQRIINVQNALQPAGLVGLIAFGNCWRGANICYFTEFRPLDGVSDIANAIFFFSVQTVTMSQPYSYQSNASTMRPKSHLSLFTASMN